MLRVGITGGIGTGKSTISRIFELLGVPVYDADSKAKWLMANSPMLKTSIIALFGEESYQGDEVNREYLAEAVFSNEKSLNKLNALVHPAVAADFTTWCANKETNYVLKEAALLIESGSYRELDKLIVVAAPDQLRISRVLARDRQRSREQINQIINKQIEPGKAKSYADFIIHNDESNLIIPQVLSIHQKIMIKG